MGTCTCEGERRLRLRQPGPCMTVAQGFPSLALLNSQPDNSLCIEIPLHCRMFILTASLAFTHEMPVTPHCENQNCLLTLPNVPRGTKSTPGWEELW